jgi:integrase
VPKQSDYGVKKRCGCGRARWPKCPHGWHFGFHHAGREHRLSLDVVADQRGEQAPRTKAEAVAWRDRLRSEIRAGGFAAPPQNAGAVGPLTLGDVADQYLKRHVQVPTRRPRGRREMEILIAMIRRAEIPGASGATVRFETKPIDGIARADIEAIRSWRRAEQAAGNSRAGTKGGEVGTNRLLSRLRHLLAWAVAEGHIETSPFRRGHVALVKMEASVEGARTRRLEPGEEEGLLQHADQHLRSLVVAALATGCRLGELLSLQWSQVRCDGDGEPRWLVLPATKTKTAEARVIPVSSNLRAELAMRRHGPDGKDLPEHSHVFGNEVGEPVKCIRRAWEDAVLGAHGCQAARVRGKLTSDSRAALRRINLHFHDLRREFASRLLESSADLHDVQMFLGHANVTQTSTYLSSTPTRLVKALEKLEAAGFAHDSHKPTFRRPRRPGKSAGKIAVNH